jgi:ketosteroid isomerase-like protein
MKKALVLFTSALLLYAKDSVDTLMKLDEQFCRDFAERDVDGWMSHWAEDVVVFRPDGPFIRTKSAATEHYRKAFGGGKVNLNWKPLGGMISSGSDLGFTYGTWERGDGQKGKYMTTWKKQKDGSWKIVADLGNPDTQK